MSDNTQYFSSVYSPSGSEETLIEEIKKEILPYADKVYTDNSGNLIVQKNGELPKLVISVNMDEPGFIAVSALENGFIKLAPLGTLNPLFCASQRVTFINGVCGIIVCEAEDDKCPDIKNAYADIGAVSREQALKLVPAGTQCIFDSRHTEQNGTITGHGMASRAAVRIMINALKNAKTVRNELYLVFTAKGRLPDSGVKPAVYGIEPKYFIAVEPINSNDTPKGNDPKAPLGSGIYIKAQEDRMFFSDILSDRILQLCFTKDIKCSSYLSKTGKSIADKAQFTRTGVLTAALSFGVRYPDTANETVSTEDIDNASELLTAFLQEGII